MKERKAYLTIVRGKNVPKKALHKVIGDFTEIFSNFSNVRLGDITITQKKTKEEKQKGKISIQSFIPQNLFNTKYEMEEFSEKVLKRFPSLFIIQPN